MNCGRVAHSANGFQLQTNQDVYTKAFSNTVPINIPILGRIDVTPVHIPGKDSANFQGSAYCRAMHPTV